jgi:hypothetical protein
MKMNEESNDLNGFGLVEERSRHFPGGLEENPRRPETL